MGITTKTGDKGITSLYLGGRVRKDDIRVDTCGTLDELCSFLGLLKSLTKYKKTKALLEAIQKDLFVAGAEVATTTKHVNSLKKRINKSCVKELEKNIEELERKKVFEGRCFRLPGENLMSGIFDVTRTLARNAERKAVALKAKGMLKNTDLLIYLNRLSDLLYLLARQAEKNPGGLTSKR